VKEDSLNKIVDIIVKERRNAYYLDNKMKTDSTCKRIERWFSKIATEFLTIEMPKLVIYQLAALLRNDEKEKQGRC
jgi:DNA-binding LytR/AlgR family response regulator